ncbi:MAG: hypothetical protein IJJ99_09585 [Oscillospiraceae bacterium]|nr:hypothetical protein [Oscillospiraceae bacterium]
MMIFSGKKLLILAGADVHVKAVKKAKEMGLYVAVTDYLEDSPAKIIADESWMFSITDVDAIVKKCRETGIDAVLNCCNDLAQKPYAEICRELKLPCFGTVEQYNIMTDKRRFKQFCMEHDVDVIPEYSFDDVQAGNARYPLLIKPAECRGSRGQCICASKEEAIRAYAEAQRFSLNGEAICEAYINNMQDTASAFFVVDGEPYLIKFGDRFLGQKADGLNRQVMCSRFPSAFSKQFEKNCMTKVKKMIRALGIQFGPVFLQGFFDGDTIRYYDPALRMPGSDYDLMLSRATGFDPVKSMIHFAVTGDTKTCIGNPQDAYLLGGTTCLLVTVSVRPGMIKAITGIDEIKRHPSVTVVQQKLKPGDCVPATGDIQQRAAEFGVNLNDDEDPVSFLRYIYSTFHVLDENGADMVVSKIDARKLI